MQLSARGGIFVTVLALHIMIPGVDTVRFSAIYSAAWFGYVRSNVRPSFDFLLLGLNNPQAHIAVFMLCIIICQKVVRDTLEQLVLAVKGEIVTTPDLDRVSPCVPYEP